MSRMLKIFYTLRWTFCVLFLASCAHDNILRGPITGAVTNSSARITLELADAESAAIEASPSPDFSASVVSSPTINVTTASHKFGTFDLKGLAPFTTYYFRPVLNGKPGKFREEHSFTTFPKVGKDTSFTICFGSCQYQDGYRHSNVWSQMQKLNPLLFLQLGNWTYPDKQISPEFAISDSMQAMAYENKYDPVHPVNMFLANRAVDYVYDDHDFASLDANGASPGKSHSIVAYKTYFPHYDLANDFEGIWHTFIVGNVQFFALDMRSDRSSLPTASRLGVDQRTWLTNALHHSTARWKIILSSATWNPSVPPSLARQFPIMDNWSSEDRDSITTLIKRDKIENVIVCSGHVGTSMMDDGEHSIVPEVVVGNLEAPNSHLYREFDSLGIAATTWDKGGQLSDSSNCFGILNVITSPVNLFEMMIENERGDTVARYVMSDETSKVPFAPLGMVSNGVRILNQTATDIDVRVSFEHEVPLKFYVADSAGNQVRLLTNGSFSPGSIRFHIFTTTLKAGNYDFVLETEGKIWRAHFTVK
jgi:hypothetical protein